MSVHSRTVPSSSPLASVKSLEKLSIRNTPVVDVSPLKDHKKLRAAPHLILGDRVQHQYPTMVANLVERMFQIDNPAPKPENNNK